LPPKEGGLKKRKLAAVMARERVRRGGKWGRKLAV